MDPLGAITKDFIDEVEVVSNVQDFTDVDSESAQTFQRVDPPALSVTSYRVIPKSSFLDSEI